MAIPSCWWAAVEGKKSSMCMCALLFLQRGSPEASMLNVEDASSSPSTKILELFRWTFPQLEERGTQNHSFGS